MKSDATPHALNAQQVAIVAHRGASFEAPENTMAAFELGWQQEADAIECDVHLTADGQIVCIHDADAKRTAGVEGAIASMSSQQVSQLDVGRWKDARFTGERVPRLDALLASLPAGKHILIEVKCGLEIMPELRRVLGAARDRWADLRIISFKAPVIAAVREAFPQVKAFWLTGFRKGDDGILRPTVDEVMDTLASINASGVDAQGDVEQVSEAFVGRLKSAGYEVHVWTIDEIDLARTLAARGVDSITTNRPAYLRAALRPSAATA